MPNISIALCTYNGHSYLKRQLESLLNQTMLPWEICIGDDGSSDNTLQILREFSEHASFPVKVKSNETNIGFGENFIQTSKRCSGDWIAFCDQDDFWLPNKLERCAQLIEMNSSSLKLVVHNAAIVDDKEDYRADLLVDLGYDWGNVRTFDKFELPPAWIMYGNCLVFDRSLVIDIPTDDRAWPCFSNEVHDSHDAWIPILASSLGSVTVTNDKLVKYRQHSLNVSTGGQPQTSKRKAGSRLDSGVDYYKKQAFKLRCLSDRLAERVGAIDRLEYKEGVSLASQKYSELAQAYAYRVEVVNGKSIGIRLRAFEKLVRLGAFRAPPGWGFRKRGILKDLTYSLLGRLLLFRQP